MLSTISAWNCTASFPAQPSTPPPVAELLVRYPTEGTRLVINGIFGSLSPFRAYTIDTDGAYVDVTSSATWSSSDPQVLRINPAAAPGLALLQQPGTVDLLATYQGRIASLTLLVRNTPPAPYLEISASNPPRNVDLIVGPAIFNRQSVTNAVTWSSSNERVATVDSAGRVAGIASGNVEIRATFNGFTDSYWMSVPPRR